MEELELLVEQMLKDGKSQDEITSFIKSWDANSTPKKPTGTVEKTATAAPKTNQAAVAQMEMPQAEPPKKPKAPVVPGMGLYSGITSWVGQKLADSETEAAKKEEKLGQNTQQIATFKNIARTYLSNNYYRDLIPEGEEISVQTLINNPAIADQVKEEIFKNYAKASPVYGDTSLLNILGFGEDSIEKYIGKNRADNLFKEILSGIVSDQKKQNELSNLKTAEQLQESGDFKTYVDVGRNTHAQEMLDGPYGGIIKTNKLLASAKDKLAQTSDPNKKIEIQKEINLLNDRLKEKADNASVRFFFDPITGERIDPAQAADVSNVVDETDLVSQRIAQLTGIKNADKNRLELAYFDHLQEYNEHQKLLNTTHDVTITGRDGKPFNILTDYESVYDENGTRIVKNVPLKRLVDAGLSDGANVSVYKKPGSNEIVTDLEALIKTIPTKNIELARERQALGTVYIANIDPASINKNALTTATRFVESAIDATIGTENTEKLFGRSTVKQLDEIESTLADANIQLSEAQKENFKRSLPLQIAEGTGAFIPELAKFALYEAITEGAYTYIGVTKLLSTLKNSKSAWDKTKYLALAAGMEELKFETVQLGKAETGAGGGYFLGATAARKLMPFRFKGSAAALNPVLEKVVLGGVGGAIASEVASVVEASVKQLEGDKPFMDSVKELYGDLGEAAERGIVNTFVFGLIGVHNMKPTDFKSIRAKEKIARDIDYRLYEIDSELRSLEKIEGTEYQRSKLINEATAKIGLKTTIDAELKVANRDADNGNVELFAKKAAEAKSIIDNKNSTAEQVAEAKKDLFLAEKEINSAEAKYENLLNNIKESGALGDFEYELIRGKKGKKSNLDANQNASYTPSTGKKKALLVFDLLSLKKGVVPHEFTHLIFEQALKNNKALAESFKEKIQGEINNKLKGITFGAERLSFEQLIEKNYKPSQSAIEYVTNIVEQIQRNPEIKRALIETGGFNAIRKNIVDTFAKITGKESLPLQDNNIVDVNSLLNLLYKFGKKVESGKDISKETEQLKNILIDGSKPIDGRTGQEIMTKAKAEKFASKELDNELGDKKKDIFSKAEAVYKEYSTDPAYKDNDAVIGLMVGMEFEPIVKKIVEKRRDIPGFELYKQDIIDAVTSETRPGFNGIPDLVALYNRGQKLIAFAKKNIDNTEAINKKAAELGINEKRIADFVEMAKGNKEQAALTSFVYGQLPNRIQGIIERKFPELGRSFELTEGAEGKLTEAETMTVEDSFVGEGGFYDLSAPEVTVRASKERAYKVLDLPEEFITTISKPIEKFLLSKLPDLEARTVGNFTTEKGESINASLYDNGTATIILDGAPITIKARTQADVANYLIKEGLIKDATFAKSRNFREAAIEYSKNAIFNNLQDYVGGTLKKGTVASPAYAEFVNKSYGLYKNYLTQSNINKRFSVFADPVIDKATGKQARAKTAIGEPIFKKREITPQEWSEYFILGTGSKSGRIDGRRRSLLEAISEEIGGDQIVSKLFENEFKDVFEKRQMEISDNLIDNYQAIIAKNLDRGIEPESFASKELIDTINEIKAELDIKDNIGFYTFISDAQYSKDRTVLASYDKFKEALRNDLYNMGLAKHEGEIIKNDNDTKTILKESFDIETGKYEYPYEQFDRKNVRKKDIGADGKIKPLRKIVFPNKSYKTFENVVNEIAKSFNYEFDNVILGNVLGGYNRFTIKTSEGKIENINGGLIDKIVGEYKKGGIVRNDFVHSKDPSLEKITAELNQSKTKEDRVDVLKRIAGPAKEITNRQNKVQEYFDTILLTFNKLRNVAKEKGEKEFEETFGVIYNILRGNSHFTLSRDYSQILWIDVNAKADAYKNAHSESVADFNAKVIAELYNGTLTKEVLQKFKEDQVSILTDTQTEKIVDDILGKSKSAKLLVRPLLAEIVREKTIVNLDTKFINIAEDLRSKTIADQYKIAENLYSVKENKFLSDIIKDKIAKSFEDQFKGVNAKEAKELAQESIIALLDAKPETFASKELELKEKEFALNEMIERKKGFRATEKVSKARASQLGKDKGRLELILPPNAQDFHDMLYNFYGKGKQGEADMRFMKENLIDPFENAENSISTHREDLAVRFKLLNKKLKSENVKLDSELVDGVEKLGFTVEQAARVYIWSKLKYEIPNISGAEQARLINAVRRNQKLRDFADGLMEMTEMGGKYPEPDNNWFADNIKSELYSHINKSVRSKYLEPWQENVNAIFSKDNLNKIEAVYGKAVRFNLEQALSRMKTGRNRPMNLGKAESAMLDYINGSNAVTMFVNTRSAVLQTISAVNFINWSDNNIYSAGKTLTDPKNFAKVYLELWNSDFLRQRRSGLQLDITESEIAEAIGQNKNKAKALFAKLMQAGYKPTQMADSFAIAIGGTPFYINRTKKYMSEGMTEAEAKAAAFRDFRSLAEESQQSSRQDRVSNIQTGLAGRLIFSFNNTPFQMTRIMKRSALDLANRRGNDKENMSKLIYYSTVQSVIFYALQQGLFSAAFGDEDEKTTAGRYEKLGDGMISGFLRGTGLPGAVLSTAYLTAKNYQFETEKGYSADYGNTINQMLSISPPLSTKTRSVYSALKSRKYYLNTKKGLRELETKQGAFENPVMRSNIKLLSTLTNTPLSRLQTKMDNLGGAIDSEYAIWQRAALAAGWDKYSLGLYNKKPLTEEEAKISSEERSARARQSAAERKKKEMKAMSEMTSEELIEYLESKNK